MNKNNYLYDYYNLNTDIKSMAHWLDIPLESLEFFLLLPGILQKYYKNINGILSQQNHDYQNNYFYYIKYQDIKNNFINCFIKNSSKSMNFQRRINESYKLYISIMIWLFTKNNDFYWRNIKLSKNEEINELIKEINNKYPMTKGFMMKKIIEQEKDYYNKFRNNYTNKNLDNSILTNILNNQKKLPTLMSLYSCDKFIMEPTDSSMVIFSIAKQNNSLIFSIGDEVNGIFNNSKKLDPDSNRMIFSINDDGIIFYEKFLRKFQDIFPPGQDYFFLDFMDMTQVRNFPQELYISDNHVMINNFYLFKDITDNLLKFIDDILMMFITKLKTLDFKI